MQQELETKEIVPKKRIWDAFGFQKKEWKWTLFFACLFLVCSVGCYFFAVKNQTQTEIYHKKIVEIIQTKMDMNESSFAEMQKENPSDNLWKMQFSDAWSILKNNLLVALTVIIGGMITIYFYPVIAMAMNGVALGIVLGMSKLSNHLSHPLHDFATSILPHGIFEFPAIFLSCAIGVKLGKANYQKLFKKEMETPYKQVWKESLLFFICVILPLFIVAAGVEIFITPHIM